MNYLLLYKERKEGALPVIRPNVNPPNNHSPEPLFPRIIIPPTLFFPEQSFPRIFFSPNNHPPESLFPRQYLKNVNLTNLNIFFI